MHPRIWLPGLTSQTVCVSEVMKLGDPENFPIRHKTLCLLSNEETLPLITCPLLQNFEGEAVHSLGFDLLHKRRVEGKREEGWMQIGTRGGTGGLQRREGGITKLEVWQGLHVDT